MVRLLFAFIRSGAEVIVWTGGGKDHADKYWYGIKQAYPEEIETLVERDLGAPVRMMKDARLKPDLVFDDQEVGLGITNVCIPPSIK